MSLSKPDHSPDPPRDQNLWKRVITAQPRVTSGASMWALYVTGALLIVGAVFLVIASLLLVTGEVGSGAASRMTGAVGIVVAVALFLAGRWMTGAMAPRS